MTSLELVFNYQIAKIGNGLQTIIPNFKDQGYILSEIQFENISGQPEIEVTISHGGTHQKFGTSYFQIFDRIGLKDYWYKLTDGDRVDLSIKNKSNRVMDLSVKYRYKPSRGTLVHSSNIRAGDLKDNNIFEDLSNGTILTDLYLKTATTMRSIKLKPKFKIVSDDVLDGLEDECLMTIDANETVLDFTSEDLINIRSMLAYYTIEIDFADNDQQVYILAYGFKR